MYTLPSKHTHSQAYGIPLSTPSIDGRRYHRSSDGSYREMASACSNSSVAESLGRGPATEAFFLTKVWWIMATRVRQVWVRKRALWTWWLRIAWRQALLTAGRVKKSAVQGSLVRMWSIVISFGRLGRRRRLDLWSTSTGEPVYLDIPNESALLIQRHGMPIFVDRLKAFIRPQSISSSLRAIPYILTVFQEGNTWIGLLPLENWVYLFSLLPGMNST